MKMSEIVQIIREEVEVILTNEEAIEMFDLDPAALLDEMMNDERELEEIWTGAMPSEPAARRDDESCSDLDEDKPSSGLSKKKKSKIAKDAKAGKDIGKKGKGFKKVAAKAAKRYGSKEAGDRVAAAAMWANAKR